MTTDAVEMESAEPVRDPWFPHFLRYFGVSLSTGVSFYVLAGFFWWPYITNRTGYRKRDALLLLVPIVGAYVGAVCLWRYTARSVYWSQREDRTSDILRGWQRPAAIAGGYVFWPVLIFGAIALGLADEDWTEADRDEIRRAFVETGLNESEAQCALSIMEREFPDAVPTGDESNFESAVQGAIRTCDLPE